MVELVDAAAITVEEMRVQIPASATIFNVFKNFRTVIIRYEGRYERMYEYVGTLQCKSPMFKSIGIA